MECLAILYLLFTKSDSEDKILPSTIPTVTEQNPVKTSVLESKALPLNLPSQLLGSYIYWGPGWAGGILGNLGYERKSPRYTCHKEPLNGVSDEAGAFSSGHWGFDELLSSCNMSYPEHRSFLQNLGLPL